LAFCCSSDSCLRRGKSTSTSTRFFFAYSENSGLEKTSEFNLMHHPHQSEPVKSSITSFFSALACACAFGTSVSHFNSSPRACNSVRPVNNPTASAFISFFIFSYGLLDDHGFSFFTVPQFRLC